jgi:hypothetical protein
MDSRESRCRRRKDNGQQNPSATRKFAINVLRQDTGRDSQIPKTSRRARLEPADWNGEDACAASDWLPSTQYDGQVWMPWAQGTAFLLAAS